MNTKKIQKDIVAQILDGKYTRGGYIDAGCYVFITDGNACCMYRLLKSDVVIDLKKIKDYTSNKPLTELIRGADVNAANELFYESQTSIQNPKRTISMFQNVDRKMNVYLNEAFIKVVDTKYKDGIKSTVRFYGTDPLKPVTVTDLQNRVLAIILPVNPSWRNKTK